MKITNIGNTDSGAGTAGWKAYGKGIDWREAVDRWAKNKRNSLWIKSALLSFRRAGGVVPDEQLDRKAYRRITSPYTGMHSSHKRK